MELQKGLKWGLGGFRGQLREGSGAWGFQGILIGQEGLGGASRVLSRAGKAQRGLGCCLGEGSAGVCSVRQNWGARKWLGGLRWSVGLGKTQSSAKAESLKRARLSVGGDSGLVSTRGTHLLTVRHWHPFEYPQGRVAYRHPLFLPAEHNADGADRAWGTTATNPASPATLRLAQRSVSSAPCSTFPAPHTVIGWISRPSRALPSPPHSHWPAPPRLHPLVGRALPGRTPRCGDWLREGGGALPPAGPPSPSADALDGCHHLLDVILGAAAGLGPHRAPRHGARSPAALVPLHPPPHPAPRTRPAQPARALRVVRHHARHAPAAAPAQTYTPHSGHGNDAQGRRQCAAIFLWGKSCSTPP